MAVTPVPRAGRGGVPPSSLSDIRSFISCDQLLRSSVRRFRCRAVDNEYVTLALLLVLLRRPNIVEELVMCGLCCFSCVRLLVVCVPSFCRVSFASVSNALFRSTVPYIALSFSTAFLYRFTGPLYSCS